MQGTALIFINLEQAARCGHVAWGFSTNESGEQYYFGSTDHLWRHPWWDLGAWCRYAHLPPDSNNDWWGETGTWNQMMTMMSAGHHLRYHLAKRLSINSAQPESALRAAEGMRSGGWSLLTNNCVHQTYRVIKEYGCAYLPQPELPLKVIPKTWFAAIPGDLLSL